jgi:hypothetical protein
MSGRSDELLFLSIDAVSGEASDPNSKNTGR